MFDNVLAPLDGSGVSEAVLPWLKRLAASHRVRLFLLRVEVPQRIVTGYEGYVAVDPVPDAPQLAEEARRYLLGVAAQFGPQADVRCLVRAGEPGPEIVRAARECGADLIAMCTHGRAGLGRLVLGSVADYVVRESGLPVTVIRPDSAAVARGPSTRGAQGAG